MGASSAVTVRTLIFLLSRLEAAEARLFFGRQPAPARAQAPPVPSASSLMSAWGGQEYGPDEAGLESIPAQAVGEEFSESYSYRVPKPLRPIGQQVDDGEPDALQMATQAVRKQVVAFGGVKRKVRGPPPLVSGPTCAAGGAALGAMSCSLVTQISGYPEGCECRFAADKCPPADPALGFTGVSQSQSFHLPQMGSTTLTLCFYWQWLPPTDHSEANAAKAAEVKKYAEDTLKKNIELAGSITWEANLLNAFTPPPPKPTEPPVFTPTTMPPTTTTPQPTTTTPAPTTTTPAPTTTALSTTPAPTTTPPSQIIPYGGFTTPAGAAVAGTPDWLNVR